MGLELRPFLLNLNYESKQRLHLGGLQVETIDRVQQVDVVGKLRCGLISLSESHAVGGLTGGPEANTEQQHDHYGTKQHLAACRHDYPPGWGHRRRRTLSPWW